MYEKRYYKYCKWRMSLYSTFRILGEIKLIGHMYIREMLFNIGDRIDFEFKSQISDYFIKSGNLGGFQIFFRDEFFAPFGYSGEVNNGFYLKEKINQIRKKRL